MTLSINEAQFAHEEENTMAFYGTDINDFQYNNVERAQYGGDGDDTLTKNDGSSVAYGGNGNDTLFHYNSGYMDAFGGHGNDWLFVLGASPSNCFLYGEVGFDVIQAGSANDYIEGGQDSDRLEGNAGADTIYGGDGDDSSSVSITAGTGAADFTKTKAGGLYGGDGFDYLDGGQGNDTLDGGADNDTLYGGDGDDRLIGGAGADRMAGGDGNDTYIVDNAVDRITEGLGLDGGNDSVATSVSFGLRDGVFVEKLTTTASGGTGAINLAGNEYGQAIGGNAGANIIAGEGGNDTLSGLGGNDQFFFNTALSASGNLDRITDFSNVAGNNDLFRLDNAIFTALAATGTLAAGFFKANTSGTATDANDHIVYETDTGKLFYDSNGSASGGSVQFALLTGNPTLTAADFFVV